MEIITSWIASRPSANRVRQRDQLLSHLSNLIQSLGGQYSIVPFGSVAVASDGNTSDLDLTIADADHPDGFDDPRLFVKPDAPYNTHKLARILSGNKGGMDQVQAVPWAKVPVVKFVDPISRIEVDINCNNLGGANNTRWLLSYLQLAPYTLRPLIHAVKKWASARNINDPSGQKGGTSFSSYTLTLLCVAYLQAAIFRVPGHTTAQSYLPNLQSAALLDRLSIPKTFLHFRDRPPTILKMETTFASLASLPAAETASWQARNARVDVGHVLQGFFAFYAGVAGGTFDWNEGMVSPLEGGFVRRLREGEPGVERVNDVGRGRVGGVGVRRLQDTELSERWSYGWVSVEGEEARLSQLAKWGKVGMVVRDPFELGKNCTQVIHEGTASRIQAEFARAERLMRDPMVSFADVVCEPSQLEEERYRSDGSGVIDFPR